jgi:hypothetical protein
MVSEHIFQKFSPLVGVRNGLFVPDVPSGQLFQRPNGPRTHVGNFRWRFRRRCSPVSLCGRFGLRPAMKGLMYLFFFIIDVALHTDFFTFENTLRV